jgi:hypothetical protein
LDVGVEDCLLRAIEFIVGRDIGDKPHRPPQHRRIEVGDVGLIDGEFIGIIEVVGGSGATGIGAVIKEGVVKLGLVEVDDNGADVLVELDLVTEDVGVEDGEGSHRVLLDCDLVGVVSLLHFKGRLYYKYHWDQQMHEDA